MMHRTLPSVSYGVLTFSILAALAGCSSSSGGTMEESTSAAKSAVIKGKPSDSSQDAVVLLVHYDPANRTGGVGECTGTLIAPNLVLTARHCVADTDPYAACDADGKPLAAGQVRANHKADTMYVFTGKDRPDFSRGAPQIDGQGKKILDDGGTNLCNHDIALILLKEPIKGAQIAPLRLESEVEKGETITAVGWGVTEKTPQPDQRQQRSGVKVLEVGPDKTAVPAVPPNEFQVGESICSGDSGGPAFAESTGAIVGVVSRGGNMTQPDSSDPSATCIDGENLYTKVAPFKDLILEAFQLAEAEPWLEGQPDPRKLKPGNACTEASECRSDLCLADPSQNNETTCAQACTADAECEEGKKCVAEGDVSVCRTPKADPPKDGGGICSYAPASPGSSTSGVLFAVAALGLAAFRRRRG